MGQTWSNMMFLFFKDVHWKVFTEISIFDTIRNFLSFNSFHATGFFLYILKTSEKPLSFCFQRYIKKPVTWTGLTYIEFWNLLENQNISLGKKTQLYFNARYLPVLYKMCSTKYYCRKWYIFALCKMKIINRFKTGSTNFSWAWTLYLSNFGNYFFHPCGLLRRSKLELTSIVAKIENHIYPRYGRK